MEKVDKNEEIDLLALFLKCVNIVRDNFLLITIFFLCGTILGVFYYYNSRKVFESRMVISSDILTKSFSEKIFDNTRTYLRENNRKAIASQLNISENTANQIGQIKIESVTEIADVKEQEKFMITAEVFHQEILPELQRGILYFLENNEFVKVRVKQKKDYLQQMITKIEQEIKDLEDFKNKLFKGDFLKTMDGNLMFDPTGVNTKIIELTKEKLTLQNELNLANSVQVIEGFNKFERPIKPSLSVSIAAGSFIGLLFVGILIAFKSIRKLLRMADAAKQTTS